MVKIATHEYLLILIAGKPETPDDIEFDVFKKSVSVIGGLYKNTSSIESIVLLAEEFTKDELISTILEEISKRGDVKKVLIWYNGHGFHLGEDEIKETFLEPELPLDEKDDKTDYGKTPFVEVGKESWANQVSSFYGKGKEIVNGYKLYDLCQSALEKKGLKVGVGVILDCCNTFLEPSVGYKSEAADDKKDEIPVFSEDFGFVLCSSRKHQRSWYFPDGSGFIFSKNLIQKWQSSFETTFGILPPILYEAIPKAIWNPFVQYVGTKTSRFVSVECSIEHQTLKADITEELRISFDKYRKSREDFKRIPGMDCGDSFFEPHTLLCALSYLCDFTDEKSEEGEKWYASFVKETKNMKENFFVLSQFLNAMTEGWYLEDRIPLILECASSEMKHYPYSPRILLIGYFYLLQQLCPSIKSQKLDIDVIYNEVQELRRFVGSFATFKPLLRKLLFSEEETFARGGGEGSWQKKYPLGMLMQLNFAALMMIHSHFQGKTAIDVEHVKNWKLRLETQLMKPEIVDKVRVWFKDNHDLARFLLDNPITDEEAMKLEKHFFQGILIPKIEQLFLSKIEAAVE